MFRSRRKGLVLAIAVVLMPIGTTEARELSFEQRVQVQEAIEKLRHRHRTGTTGPFEEAVPRAVLESQVRRYLEQSAALERDWNTPVTADALRRESERIARRTRMPARLRELYTALDHDGFLFQECIARPVLVNRLTRSFFATDERIHGTGGRSPDPSTRISWDDWWRVNRKRFHHDSVEPVADAFAPVPETGSGRNENDGESCPAPDIWDNGVLEGIPGRQVGHVTAWTGTEMVTWGGLGGGGTGLRYDPALDVWWPVTWMDAPAGRGDAAAVWTGSELIVWGGSVGKGAVHSNDGARYDPVADTWSPISAVGAPAPRRRATAVWTGTEMIVWGGDTESVVFGDGGRYDPATDTWTMASDVGAPVARTLHTAVWTGSEMIVWGGIDKSFDRYGNGGRYDPATDSWAPTSLQFSPAPRSEHTAVWSGEEMIVWGGNSLAEIDAGARYDPTADRWRSVSDRDAPEAHRRVGHSAVWTGDRMIVWGGMIDVSPLQTGGVYDPSRNRWTPVSTINAPEPRSRHSAVWTGSLMVVALGDNDEGGGRRYDPSTDTWTPIGSAQPPVGRSHHVAVWTGAEMIVWGGRSYSFDQNTGGVFDPVLESWRPTTTTGAPTPRWSPTTVWTGSEMIVWGGVQGSHDVYLGDGGRYNPVADSWIPLPLGSAPSPRVRHTAVWTGQEMIVWGGFDGTARFLTGSRYRPDTDTWTATATTGAPAARQVHTAVWTGRDMVVWGGSIANGVETDTGGLYRPDADAWRRTTTVNAPTPRWEHSAVWTGERMIVWGGKNGELYRTGASYDPMAEIWIPIDPTDAPDGRRGQSATWTGSDLFVWGGDQASISTYLGSAGRYRLASGTWRETPDAPPSFGRTRHTAVWSGDHVIVWGGDDGGPVRTGARYVVDTDDDGIANVCDNDDDGDAVPDLEDCLATDAGVWAIPGEARDLSLEHDPSNRQTTLRWSSPLIEAGASSTIRYDVLRSLDPARFESADCVDSFLLPAQTTDVEIPSAGTAFHYLVRARNRCPDGRGSLGEDSTGIERVGTVCP